MYSDPLAFFITWTVYGTHLPGDHLGWVKWHNGFQLGDFGLVRWHQARLKHSIRLLDPCHRQAVNAAVAALCEERRWKLWIVNARSNHVHVVVSAADYSGDTVRDQLKARATKVLREIDPGFLERPVWTRGGDWKSIFEQADVAACVLYAGEVQERKTQDCH